MHNFPSKKSSEKTSVITARIPEGLLKGLSDIARKEDVSRTDVVVTFLNAGVSTYEKNGGTEDEQPSVFE